MKHLCITYHMDKPGETAEDCIVLPMEDSAAEEILRFQDEVQSMKQSTMAVVALEKIFQSIAKLQGYETASFCSAEEDLSE